MYRLLVGLSVIAFFLFTGCESLKKGECKRDSDCKAEIKGVPACYKEPPDAEIGKCMSVREAKAALARYKLKATGKCEDKDGDGVKSGDACDPPTDCDDNDPMIKPGASETCDSKDNNCDGVINEGLRGCVGTVLGGKQEPVVKFMTTQPAGVEVAPNGDVGVSDQHQIYRIDTKFKVHRVAGSNRPGNDDKKGKFARFDEPRGLAAAKDGTVYVTDCRNNCVRRIEPDGQVSAYVGKCSSEADDSGLDKDGNAKEARFWCPIDITFDRDGSLLVVDMRNSKIKRIGKDRKVTTVAGKGGHQDAEGYIVFGYKNGPALTAEFDQPAGIAVGPDGTAYIADMKNNCIRSFKDDRVGTFAGVCASGSDKGGYKDGKTSKARFNMPNSVDVGPDGSVYVADTHNGEVKRALFNGPQTLSVSRDGVIYVVDFGNYRVRRIVP
jgi:sugar lactone lactonase YvrE